MKINDSTINVNDSHQAWTSASMLPPVSTFGSRSGLEPIGIDGQRVVSTCDISQRVQGTSVSVVATAVSADRRYRTVQAKTANTALLPTLSTGIAKRNGMGAPRGIPPRGRPKWA